MIERTYSFTCDCCGNVNTFLADNIIDAKHEARLENWIIYHKSKCFCTKECMEDYLRAEQEGYTDLRIKEENE